MSLLVFECGADAAEPVIEAGKEMARAIQPSAVSLLYLHEAASYNFRDSSCSFDEALRYLGSSLVSSVMLSGKRSEDGFVVVHGPSPGGRKALPWSAYAERQGAYCRESLEPYKDILDLRFVYVSLEDTLEVETLNEISVGTFPWSHWRLLCAAVRRRDGAWEQREGLAVDSTEELTKLRGKE